MPELTRTFMARRGWPPGARAVLVVLAVQAVLGPRAGAEPPPAAGTAGVETPAPPAPGADRVPPDLEDRLRRLETLGAGVLEKNERLTEQNQQLAEQNRQLAEQNRQLASQLQDVNRRHEELVRRLDRLAATAAPPPAVVTPTATPAPPPIVATPTPPVVATPATADGTPARSDLVERTQALAPTPEVNPQGDSPRDQEPGQDRSRFLIGGYDWDKSQFVLVQPRDPERTPFALNFDLITELRYTGFARSAQTWTDSAGVVLPVRNYDTFEVNRNWFQFSGYALDPRLQFVAVIFNSSTSNSTIFLGWLDYVFSRAFTLSGGYFKIPGSREWSNSFRYTLGADRTMATTFFRPGMSPGIWASGEPWANFHYIGMIANSFNGLDLAGNRIDTNMDYSGSVWWEPFGAFGPGPSDVEWHERFTPRIGTSLTFSREQLPGPAAVLSNPENTLFRLSDGTPLSTPNALATGVQVAATSVQLWAIDAAFKYRGLSFSGEYYFRWLDDFRHTGPRLPIRSLFDNGAYAQASYFVIPKRLEGYARYSFVTGRFGGGDEWSGGFNWYVLGTRNWRMTFDVTRINHSPAENLLTGYRAGESGTLFQLQMLTDF